MDRVEEWVGGLTPYRIGEDPLVWDDFPRWVWDPRREVIFRGNVGRDLSDPDFEGSDLSSNTSWRDAEVQTDLRCFFDPFPKLNNEGTQSDCFASQNPSCTWLRDTREFFGVMPCTNVQDKMHSVVGPQKAYSNECYAFINFVMQVFNEKNPENLSRAEICKNLENCIGSYAIGSKDHIHTIWDINRVHRDGLNDKCFCF